MRLQTSNSWQHALARFASIAGLAILSSPVFAACPQEFPDYSYCERRPENSTLVVLVAGLGFRDTWSALTRLIPKDPHLDNIDYLVYYSPQERDFDGNVARFAAILKNLPTKAKYTRRVYVGHSLGGMMVKWLTLGLASTQPGELPNSVLTFGTPLRTERFDIDMFRRTAAWVGWSKLSPLEKEALNDERVKNINRSWLTAVKTEPLIKVRQISVFGAADWVAPITQERPSDVSLFIEGNHSTILPKSPQDCSFLIFKAVMRDQSPSALPCILKDKPK